MKHLRAIIFDKDGTLFDFQKSWGDWAFKFIEILSAGQSDLAHDLAKALDYDRERRIFDARSVVVAGTSMDVADILHPHLSDRLDLQDISCIMDDLAGHAQLVPVLPLEPYLKALRARGLGLGLVTNDSEEAARSHLGAQNVEHLFDFIAGYDSGHGAKPNPGQLRAFCVRTGHPPKSVAIVGDSTHDLDAGRAAGMVTVGVLTGTASAATLAPCADVVLPDIGHLTDWLDGR